jgi:hypothetical protein
MRLSGTHHFEFKNGTIAKPQAMLQLSEARNKVAASHLRLDTIVAQGDSSLENCDTKLVTLNVSSGSLRVVGGELVARQLFVSGGVADLTAAGMWRIDVFDLAAGDVVVRGSAPWAMALTGSTAVVSFRGPNGTRRILRMTGNPPGRLVFPGRQDQQYHRRRLHHGADAHSRFRCSSPSGQLLKPSCLHHPRGRGPASGHLFPRLPPPARRASAE